MPPRKSDQRKSDVSTARFALADESLEDQVEVVAQPAAASPAEAQPKSQLQKGSVSQDKAEKEKEKEKDKDKEKIKEHRDAVTIEDLTLPKSIIARLAKGALPPNTQIQANAMLALNRSATVIINYLASHANEHTINANRKTISPDDVFKALADVDMSFMRESLEREFEVFNSIQTEKRTSYRQKVRAAKQAPDGPANPGDDTDMADASLHDTTIASEGSGPRVAKKARVEAPAPGPDDAEDAETEEEPEIEEEDDDDDVVEEDDEEEEQEGEGSGDEMQDALEERRNRLDGDEAVDDDDSDDE